MKKTIASLASAALIAGGLGVTAVAIPAVASVTSVVAQADAAQINRTPRIDNSHGCSWYRGVNSRGQVFIYRICY